MVILGVDVHKDSHTIVAIDEAGRSVQQWRSGTRDSHHESLIAEVRADTVGPRLWAVEDCRHVSRRLEQALLDAGERCVRVPPKLMAGARSAARTRGKSDPIDALAIARAALREPNLPVAEHTHASRDVKLLVDHREDLVWERTRMESRLRWHLHDLDPDMESSVQPRRMGSQSTLRSLAAKLARREQTVQVRVCRELVRDIAAASRRIDALQREIAAMVAEQAPDLLEIPGCGALTAAKLVAETGNPSRFRNEACFAMHSGTAPIPASSGRTNRHRLARGGNRQLNAAIHRIAVTQIRLNGPGRDFYQRRRSQGDTSMEAIRALKRKIARRLYNTMKTNPETAVLPAAA